MDLRAMALVVVGGLLNACGGEQLPQGQYRADFASSENPDVKLAGKLMDMSLEFQQDAAYLHISALGATADMDVQASKQGDRILVTQPAQGDFKEHRLELEVQDGATLRCTVCPRGLPQRWVKVNP